MSFEKNKLVRIGSVGGFHRYLYATNDTKNSVEGANYFGDAADMLGKGDVIEVMGDLDGTAFVTSYVVASDDDATITLTEASTVTQNVLQEVLLPKISTKAADAEVFRYVPNFAGEITEIRSVLNGALATGDATLTTKINGVNVTSGALTLTQAGSAAGDVDHATPSAAKTFNAGDVISVTAGGASTATASANVSLLLTPS